MDIGSSKGSVKGFTLIELLVVIAIIGVLSSVVLVSLDQARARARDAQRLSDMRQIETALEFYYQKHGQYPDEEQTPNRSGWEVSTGDSGQFLEVLVSEGYLPKYIVDPINTGNQYYRYHRYSPGQGSYGCDLSRGHYYVLGIYDMESSGRPHPQSPGWSCTHRNWQIETDWVTGKYEH